MSTSGPVVILVDDTRTFKDGRKHLVARNSHDGVLLLRQFIGKKVDALWLDHDLAGRQSSRYVDTVMPVVDELVRAAQAGTPYDVGVVQVQTANPAGAIAIRRALEGAGYRVERSRDPRIWTNKPQQYLGSADGK